MYGKGNTIRDYTYVEDIVGAFISAISYDQSLFEIINIGNNQPISLIELVNNLEEVFDVKSKIIFEKEQPGDVPITFANIEKAKLLLNYSPKTSVKEGLSHFKSWILKNNELVNGK